MLITLALLALSFAAGNTSTFAGSSFPLKNCNKSPD